MPHQLFAQRPVQLVLRFFGCALFLSQFVQNGILGREVLLLTAHAKVSIVGFRFLHVVDSTTMHDMISKDSINCDSPESEKRTSTLSRCNFSSVLAMIQTLALFCSSKSCQAPDNLSISLYKASIVCFHPGAR